MGVKLGLLRKAKDWGRLTFLNGWKKKMMVKRERRKEERDRDK